jgi:hypothetical protein
VGKEELLNDLEDYKNWRVNDERLERIDDNGKTLYFYDKIDVGFLAFRKMVLVDDNGIVDLSLFAKKKLYKKVVHRGYKVEERMKLEAMAKMFNSNKSEKRDPRKSRFHQRMEDMAMQKQERIAKDKLKDLESEHRIETRKKVREIQKGLSRNREWLDKFKTNMLNE